MLSVLPMARLADRRRRTRRHDFASSRCDERLTNPTTWTATAHSLVTAFGGTFLAVVIGGGVAVIVSLTDIRGRDAFVFCFVMPLLLHRKSSHSRGCSCSARRVRC